jgi:hypothetical protein
VSIIVSRVYRIEANTCGLLQLTQPDRTAANLVRHNSSMLRRLRPSNSRSSRVIGMLETPCLRRRPSRNAAVLISGGG